MDWTSVGFGIVSGELEDVFGSGQTRPRFPRGHEHRPQGPLH